MSTPTLATIRAAAALVAPFIHRTPVLRCHGLEHLYGAELHFKCENFQKIGAFKIRGATNAVLSLSEQQVARGVATHSSGNHAAALALAARQRRIPAYVVMPENAPQVKQAAVAGYGAEIIFCEANLPARETALAEVVARTGAVFIPPYDDDAIIAGQGTCALELCEEVTGLEIVIAPVGGGGLLAGTAVAVKSLRSDVQLIGAEPERADDAYRSLQAGHIIPPDHPDTIADGLLTALGQRNFAIIQQQVDAIVTVSEQRIIDAMRDIWERMKIIVEPSAAVALAVLKTAPERFAGRRIGVILSGGNVDLDRLPWQL